MNQALRGPDLKAHIAGIAASLFYAHGINKIGVDRIADTAGVTKRTLYHHFGSKDALITEAVRASPIVLFPPSGSPVDRIYGTFDALASFLTDTAFRGCPYIIFTAELTERRHPARQLIERRIMKRRKWYEARLQELGAREPEALAEELDVLFDGALAVAAKSGTLEPVIAARRVVTRLLETECLLEATSRSAQPLSTRDRHRFSAR